VAGGCERRAHLAELAPVGAGGLDRDADHEAGRGVAGDLGVVGAAATLEQAEAGLAVRRGSLAAMLPAASECPDRGDSG
jgi:hypothetical protein